MLEELPKEYQMKKCLFCAKSLFGHFLPILTHIDKFSGRESGAFLENFSKKSFYYLMTSPWTIIGMSHVASIGGGLVHLGMISK